MKLKYAISFLIAIFLTVNLSAQKRYGLIFGSNYKGNKAGISELNLCEADATYMYDQVKKAGNFDDVRIVLGKDVTKDNIEKEIKAIGKKVEEGDTVFLYFAGHGFYQRDAAAKNGMKNYIVCYERPHMSDDELNELLKSIKSEKTVFALDCCFSGGITKKGKSTRGSKDVPVPYGSDGVVRQDPEDFFFQNKAVISSADDNQTAIEVGGSINHGIFTYHFGRAFESGDLNGDKVITALEAFYHSRDAVVTMAKQFDHKQTPQISGNASGIILSGEKKPEPNPNPYTPNVNPTTDPAYDPVKPNPNKPPVNNDEPPANNTVQVGDLLLKTSIIANREYGVLKLPISMDMMKAKKQRKGARNIKVLVDDKEYPFDLVSVESTEWGATIARKGQVYHILLKKVPTGVHKIDILADDYPKIQTTFAVLKDKKNELDLFNSMTGFGAIKGQIFYKTLDNPISGHPVYMPTVKSVQDKHKTATDKDGYFWFTNLLPGNYDIRANFTDPSAKPLNLSNSIITVKDGEVTEIQIILNTKLPRTKSKY